MSVSELDNALHASVLQRAELQEQEMAKEDAKKREEHYEKQAAMGG